MNEPTTQSRAPAAPEAKRPSLFVLALRIGVVIAAVATLLDAVRIWGKTPSPAELVALGTTPDETGLLAYRLSMVLGAALPNLVLWFIVALVVVFIVRQIKKA